jgi:hypothetical protein
MKLTDAINTTKIMYSRRGHVATLEIIRKALYMPSWNLKQAICVPKTAFSEAQFSSNSKTDGILGFRSSAHGAAHATHLYVQGPVCGGINVPCLSQSSAQRESYG